MSTNLHGIADDSAIDALRLGRRGVRRGRTGRARGDGAKPAWSQATQ